MPTVLQFLSDTLADAGIIQPGQSPSAPHLQFALRKWFEMLSDWSGTRERLFFIPEVTYQMSGGKGTYSIGPGAPDFDTIPGVYVRPLFVQAARVKVGTNRKWALNLLTRPQWDVNQAKTLQDPDGPLDFFHDTNAPIATFNVAPMPSGGQSLYVSQWNPLPRFDETQLALNVEDSYPEQYLKPMRLGLQIEVASSFGRQIKQEVPSLFAEAIARLERKNMQATTGSFGESRTLEVPVKGEAGAQGQ